jgi:hypothetical protein
VAVGNTLGRTQASRHIQACRTTSWVMASRHRFGRVRRPVHRDARVAIGAWRLAFGVDGCVLGFELAASGLDDSPLRYAFQWMCGHSAAVATHRAEMLDGRSFRTNAVAITRRTEAGGHSVLEKDPVSCALMSGLLRDACRWPSWVCAYVSGTNLSGGLEAHGC